MKTNTFLESTINSHQNAFHYRGKLCVLFLIGCMLLIQANSQTDKRLAMADQYFSAGEYFTAAGLYGQFLNSVRESKYQNDFPLNVHRNAGRIGNYKSKADILFKQAESYRMANYWSEASTVYKECIEKDSVKYHEALYWNAVCERSLGNYTEAEKYLNRFLDNNSSNDESYGVALKEKQTLEFVKTQLGKPDSVMYHTQKIITGFGDNGIFAPVSVRQNQFLFTSTQRESGFPNANPYHNRLFRSALLNNDLQNREAVLIESIDSSLNQGAACVSADNNHLYFTQWKKENGQTISSIYYSNKTANGWSKPQLLTSVNEPGHNSKQPF